MLHPPVLPYPGPHAATPCLTSPYPHAAAPCLTSPYPHVAPPHIVMAFLGAAEELILCPLSLLWPDRICLARFWLHVKLASLDTASVVHLVHQHQVADRMLCICGR